MWIIKNKKAVIAPYLMYYLATNEGVSVKATYTRGLQHALTFETKELAQKVVNELDFFYLGEREYEVFYWDGTIPKPISIVV